MYCGESYDYSCDIAQDSWSCTNADDYCNGNEVNSQTLNPSDFPSISPTDFPMKQLENYSFISFTSTTENTAVSLSDDSPGSTKQMVFRSTSATSVSSSEDNYQDTFGSDSDPISPQLLLVAVILLCTLCVLNALLLCYCKLSRKLIKMELKMYQNRNSKAVTRERSKEISAMMKTKHPPPRNDEDSKLRMPSDEGVVDEDEIKVLPPGSRIIPLNKLKTKAPDESDSDSNSDLYHFSPISLIRSTFQTDGCGVSRPSIPEIKIP